MAAMGRSQHTQLAKELDDALVEIDIVVLKFLDDPVCLGSEAHCERHGGGSGGRKGFRVVADRFGRGLG